MDRPWLQAYNSTRKPTTGRGNLRSSITDKVWTSAHRGQRARNHSLASYLCEEAAPVLSEWGCIFLKWRTLGLPNLVTKWYTTGGVGVSASSARDPLTTTALAITCLEKLWRPSMGQSLYAKCSSRVKANILFLYQLPVNLVTLCIELQSFWTKIDKVNHDALKHIVWLVPFSVNVFMIKYGS